MPGHQAAETRPPGRIPVDLFVLAMQPALVNSPDLHANPITESDIRHNLAYRPLKDSAPDGLPEALSGLHINPGPSRLMPLFPGRHEPADGTENEARYLYRSRTRSWTVEVRVS